MKNVTRVTGLETHIGYPLKCALNAIRKCVGLMMVEYKTINDIPAIKTRYKNTMFRSRLEAKWAVFFDECGIKWEHEPKCFNIDGIKYLPDFLLHDVIICFDGKTDLFAEVKGKMTKESIKKIKRFTFGRHTM